MKQDKSNAVKSYKNRCSNYFITDREIKEILKNLQIGCCQQLKHCCSQ